MIQQIQPIRLGIIGAGHLGRYHIECARRIEGFELAGFHDVNTDRAIEIASQYQVKALPTLDALLSVSDAVCVVTPTTTHFELGQKAIASGKHIFIEKPLTGTTSESNKLASLIRSSGLVGRVGHVERYNPAFLAAKKFGINKPVFIEAHRLASFNARGLDVPVVMDLMIHDIDIVLSLIDADIERIDANGVGVVGKSADICNARITFTNKAVANLTASRISLKQMRKFRLFQRDQYMAIDFLQHEVQLVRLYQEEPSDKLSMKIDLQDGEKWIAADQPEVHKNNAIEEELREFCLAIQAGSGHGVTFDDGARAVDVANQIMQQITPYEI